MTLRERGVAWWWVALASVVAFGGSLFSGFHFDDYGMLQDAAVVAPGGWLRCWGLLQTRPLTWFTFWLNYQIGGRDPLLWHAVNLALHAACAVMLYRVLLRAARPVALLGALLFAVHPIQAEAVDYVYARAILLATLFSLLAMYDWWGERWWRSAGWLALAVLSKEECVTVPLVLALVAWRRGQLRERWAPIATMLGICVAAGVRVMAAIQITGMKNIGANAGISPVGYLTEQGIAILRYCGLLTVPWGFTVEAAIPTPALMWRVLAWLILLGLAAVAVARWGRVSAAAWILVGLILLLPSSSIFPAADLAADRRMYLPMVAFAPAIALLLPEWRMRWSSMVTILLGVLTVLAMERTRVWSSDARLWGEAVRMAPEKVRPRIQLSRAVSPAEGLTVLQEAEQFAPQDAEVQAELARVELELGRPAEALSHAGRALALTPREPHALNNRGAVLLAMKQSDAARRDFLAALRIDPCLDEARENLARSGGIPAEAPSCRSSKTQ